MSELEGKQFIINGEILQGVFNYLINRPYGEVAHLMEGMRNIPRWIPPNPELNEEDNQDNGGTTEAAGEDNQLQDVEQEEKD